MACKYKDIFGKPGKEVHAIRIPIINVALVDVVVTVLVSIIISVVALGTFNTVSVLWTTLALFLSGILAHRIFCVRTTVDKALFPQ
jgi:hypothetical protein